MSDDNMKIINEPIKMLAAFNTVGNIEPIKFIYQDQSVRVQRILKTYDDKALINNNLYFVCQHNGGIYELRYNTKENTWYLYKK